MSKKNRIKNKEANLQKRINAASNRNAAASTPISAEEEMRATAEAVMAHRSDLSAKGPMRVVAKTCGNGEGCSPSCEYCGLFTLGLLTTPEVAEELFSKLDLSAIRNYVAVHEASAEEATMDLERRGFPMDYLDGHYLVFVKMLFAHEHASHRLEEFKEHFLGANEEKVAA
ncbi:MAG: hypothetical protein RR853_05440 [Aurantimicrobium sp.]|uniref:hypothetical protein n=1 Tax=Aurantimicrobium sp. TaxID=1930784 RepID=UPI002FC59BEE